VASWVSGRQIGLSSGSVLDRASLYRGTGPLAQSPAFDIGDSGFFIAKVEALGVLHGVCLLARHSTIGWYGQCNIAENFLVMERRSALTSLPMKEKVDIALQVTTEQSCKRFVADRGIGQRYDPLSHAYIEETELHILDFTSGR